MAYEFKKLSDVEVLETTTEATNILVEENGEIVKTSSNNFKTGLLKTSYDDYANEDGTINSSITKSFSIIDGSAYGVGLNNYGQYTPQDLNDAYRRHYVDKNFIRTIMLKEGHTVRTCIGHTLINNGDGTFTGTYYFGDDIAPIIANETDNSFILDPDWVAPAEPIPAPVTAEVGQVVAVKAVDENGKPTEWEAVDMSAGSLGSPGGDYKQLVIYKQSGGSGYECNMTFDEIISALANRKLINAQKVITDLEADAPANASFAQLENVMVSIEEEEGWVPNIQVYDPSIEGTYFILQDGTVTDTNPNGAPM